MATTITIADLFPDDKGMILVAKDAVDGSLRHISQVANGAACDCVCFGCGKRMVARNGGDPVLRAHSFAHRPEDNVTDCVTSGETALHRYAKDIIAKYRRVTLPETFIPDLDGKPLLVSAEKSIDLTDIRLEIVAGEVVPDILATMPDGRPLFIEIANTHICPPEKIVKLDAMGVDVLEINVSRYKDYDLDKLDDIVLNIAQRKLILSADVKAMAAKIVEQKRLRDEKERAAAERCVAIYRDNRMRNHKKAADIADELLSLGFVDHMELDDTQPSAFVVPRRQWQAAILYRLIDTKPPASVSPIKMVNMFRDRKWGKPDLLFMKTDVSHAIAATYGADFKSAYVEVLSYLKRLEGAAVVHQLPGTRFCMTYDFKKKLKAVVERLNLPDKQRAELHDAYQSIEACMRPEDGRLWDFDFWLEGRAGRHKMTVEEFIADEGGNFIDLLNTVVGIRKAIIDMENGRRNEPPEELVGLPLSGLFERIQHANLEALHRAEVEREARQRREMEIRAARLKEEADERVAEITKASEANFDDPHLWLVTPLPEHDCKTPVQLAAESREGFAKAQAVIQKIWDENCAAHQKEVIRNMMLARLREQVYSRIQRQDMADLWLIQSWKQLGGRRPIDFCVDEKTLALCIEVLEEFVSDGRLKRRR